METKLKKLIEQYAQEEDLRYCKLTFVVQDGKVIDLVIENRIRLK